MITNDTICAVSTAPGIGGIAVIRISGKDAVLITERIYARKKGAPVDRSKALYIELW